jgi:predicted dehydrogenase/aryl-alcohol dehydrogenase-like predicted oxidoreductase
MAEKIRWGILGTGAIARCFADNLPASRTGRLVAVGSRSQETADKFAAEYKLSRAYSSYDQLLADPQVDAVYISPPHPQHAIWTILAAEAGKHILVEKPIGVNQYEAMAMLHAAKTHGVFLMEAFMYRCHPQTAKLVELLREKAIGEVRLITATFGFNAGFNPTGRHFANDLAGGGILDVGCYPASISRLIAGAATGLEFAEPLEVKGVATMTPTNVDGWATASVKFPGGILATLTTAVQLNEENVVRIFGSEGHIVLPQPWVADRKNISPGKIVIQRKGEKQPSEIDIAVDRNTYALEADVVGDAIHAGNKQGAYPAMQWDDSLGNIKTLDAWRRSFNHSFDMEKPERATAPINGRPLRRAAKPPMIYGKIKGLELPVSRMIMGVDNQDVMTHAAVVFDDYFEQGGNAFDTAYVYGATKSKNLGAWIKSRGVRKDVAVIVKGAHTPQCNPKDLIKQIAESLDNLQTDYGDIYMMHRDNTDIPVGEFVDALNQEHKAGRIRVFGGSNWSLDRVEAANAYAKKNGLVGFSVVSNNLSLARMVDAVWSGCLWAGDAASRAYLEKNQLALLSWSSQARGFFLPGKAAPGKLDDAELVRCWYAPDNFQRLERVNELAAQMKVAPINIAAAWVLSQPFPTFALIGPRTISETHSSLEGLAVKLTDQQRRWLNLEE